MTSSFKALLTAAGLMVAVSASGATVTTFTANYGNAYAGADTVSGFNAYDFAPGAVLLQGGANVAADSNITGYFESYTAGHLAPNGSTVSSPNLNTTGSGSGYELTIAGTLQEHVSSVSSGVASFSLTGGSASLFIGAPDYSFGSENTFTNGTSILTGNIIGGSGSFSSSSGLGFTKLTFQVTSYDSNVYSPGIAGATSVFTLQAPGAGGSTSFLSQVSSVGGQSVATGDLLLAGDGNLNLAAVPVPAALWLFGSGLVGLVGFAARRRR